MSAVKILPKLFPLALITLFACSTVRSSYISEGYSDDPLKMVKHVSVIVYVPGDRDGIGALAADIASDMIRLRTNYFIYEVKSVTGEWKGGQAGRDGVILFTVEKYNVSGKNRVDLQIKAELFRSADGKLLWSAGGSAGKKSDDSDLKELTALYTEKHPGTAGIYAAPLFIIIQDLVDMMPNPELTDDEIDLKIKLESGISD